MTERHYTFTEDHRMILKDAKFKTAGVPAKSELTSGDHGSIAGYFSTFDRIPDSYGDVVRKGAFLRTIRERKESGHPFPLLFNHDMNQIIGKVIEIKEDNVGAFFRAEFFDTARAQEVRGFCRSGAVYQFSFAYDVKEQGRVRLPDDKSANELRDLTLYEISIVVVPANPRAVMTDIKASIKERRKDLLRTIAKIEAEDDVEKRELQIMKRKLLWKIERLSESDMEHYRKMEKQCIVDIKAAEAAGDQRYKEVRKSALKSIRSEILRLERQGK